MVTNDAENTKFVALKRISLYRGIYTRVAKNLRVDRSFVSRVANGERSSERVEKALIEEMKRIESFSKKLLKKVKVKE